MPSKGKGKAKGKAYRKFTPSKKTVAENPFDKFANSRKKHEVLNRKVKGEDRNVGRARQKALESRKTKLMADYQANKRNNVFADRRFGEGDASLSLEEKMFMRFQKEKITKAKKASKFSLDDTEEVTLTHKGKVLSEYTDGPPAEWPSDDDDENLDKEVVNTLHFGGGFKPATRVEEEQAITKKMDSRDALQEIVMKSKLAKMEKREAKDAQEENRMKLDSAYEDLVSSALLDFNPTKRDRSEDVQTVKDPTALSYDAAMRAMAFESRAQPSDRTKSKEEIAAEELKRLEQAEAERLRRMRVAGPDDALVESALGKRKAGNKQKRLTDDDIEDFHVSDVQKSDEEEDGASGSDSDDDVDQFGNSHSILDRGSDESEDDSDDNDISAEDDDDDDDDDDVGGTDESEDDDGSHVRQRKTMKADALSPATSGKALPRQTAPGNKSQAQVENEVNPSMPHILKSPTSLEEFDAFLNDYVLNPPTDLPALVSRIIASNSVHLSSKSTSKAESMSKASVFLDILLVHFIRIGDSLPYLTEREDVDMTMSQLHFLSKSIFQLSQDVPDACRACAVKLIKNMHSTLQRNMRQYQSGESSSSWLSLGHVLLLQEFGHLFSTSDFKHGIVGPCFLLMSQCLTQCALASISDLSTGLLVACILLEYIESSEKVIPEMFMFAERVLKALTEDRALDKQELEDGTNLLPRLVLMATTNTLDDGSGVVLPWSFFDPDQINPTDEMIRTAAVGVVHTVFSLIYKLHEKYKHTKAYPELFEGLLSLMGTLENSGKFYDAPYFTAYPQHAQLRDTISATSREVKSGRQRLRWRVPRRKIEETIAPAFDVDYKLKKNVNTTNSEAVKLKVLQKQVKREGKAAMRELRRDAEFIDRERTKERDALKQARREERAKNFAWLEEQHATFKQQVRVSKGLLKGGGSGGVKPPQKRRKK